MSTQNKNAAPIRDRKPQVQKPVHFLTDNQSVANNLARGVFQSLLWHLAENGDATHPIYQFLDESFLTWQEITDHIAQTAPRPGSDSSGDPQPVKHEGGAS